MRVRIVLVLAAIAALTGGVALASSGAKHPPVAIRIEGSNKTLVLPTRLRTRSGWITKSGAPKGKCPASSVQGALSAATHGHWKGTWYSQYNEYLITSILGEKPSGHDFWEIFVNNKAAVKGACDLRLRRGEQIVFADTDGKHGPAALKAPASAAAGSSFTVKLLGYDAHGTSKPLAGVRITGHGIHPVTTDSQGEAKVTGEQSGRLVLRSSPAGYIRAEVVVHVAK
jgi:hypothetical protein